MSELKPCPFCGEEIKAVPGTNNELFGCEGDDCPGSLVEYMTLDEWNTRPIEDALQAEIERLKSERRWIHVSERLPENDVRVMFYGGFDQTTYIGYYREHATQWESENGGFWHGKNFFFITHWMPLPKTPEDESC